MFQENLPVPFGFTISTSACTEFLKNQNQLPDSLKNELILSLQKTQQFTQKNFGSTTKPLLLAVRSGASVSMPGMMDTVLNIGLNDDIITNSQPHQKNYLLDCYRRLIMMFANVVKGKSRDDYENNYSLTLLKHDSNFSEAFLLEVVENHKQIYFKQTKSFFSTRCFNSTF